MNYKLHEKMDLMESVVEFLKGLQNLSYNKDTLVRLKIQKSKEIIEQVEELKTQLWQEESDKFIRNRNRRKKMNTKCELVFWDDESSYKNHVSDEYLPHGIYYYEDDEIMHVEWYKTREERLKVIKKNNLKIIKEEK